MIGMTYGYLVILKALSRCILPSSYMDLKLLSYRGSESLKSTLALNKPENCRKLFFCNNDAHSDSGNARKVKILSLKCATRNEHVKPP